MGQHWDPYTPCDDALEGKPHKMHTYTWADSVYECRGWPGIVYSTPGKTNIPKAKIHHRLMDWLVELSPFEFYFLMGALLLSGAILFFTVVWTWVVF